MMKTVGLTASEKKPSQKMKLTAAVEDYPPKKVIPPEDLGTRYKCYKCGTKFYDLSRPEPRCPSCGVNQNDDEAKGIHKRKKRSRWSSSTFARKDYTITAPIERDDVTGVDNEEDTEYALDMDDLNIEEHSDTDNMDIDPEMIGSIAE